MKREQQDKTAFLFLVVVFGTAALFTIKWATEIAKTIVNLLFL